jgi:hypothetical protein
MSANLHLRWKRKRGGGYRAVFELAIPLREYDCRREPGSLTGKRIRRSVFEGVTKTAKHRQPNRRIPFSRGKEIGLDIERAYLELRWEEKHEDGYDWFCHYELIVPTTDGRIMRTALGGTRRGSSKPPIWEGEVDTPFRDGSHAIWDGETLGLKAWAVYGETRTEVKSKAKPESTERGKT